MADPGRAIRSRVGRAIRRLRLQRALSQERLAERAGNSSKHIGMIERGQVNVGLDVLGRIAAALSVDVADLTAPPSGRRGPRPGDHIVTTDQIDGVLALIRGFKAARAPRPARASR